MIGTFEHIVSDYTCTLTIWIEALTAALASFSNEQHRVILENIDKVVDYWLLRLTLEDADVEEIVADYTYLNFGRLVKPKYNWGAKRSPLNAGNQAEPTQITLTYREKLSRAMRVIISKDLPRCMLPAEILEQNFYCTVNTNR